MNQFKMYALAAVTAIAGFSCNDSDPIDKPASEIQMTEKSAKVVSSDNQFGLDLFRKLSVTSVVENQNLMISPLSISQALAMAYNGAEGNTRQEMEAVLHKLGMTPAEINESYQTLVKALESHDDKVLLEISNGIFYHKNFVLKNSFLTTNQTYYNAEVKSLDFTNVDNSLKTINGWVKDKTHEKIDKIIDAINPGDIMYLVNAVYFNGEWTYRFDKANTQSRTFTTAAGTTVEVPSMMVKGTFGYMNTEKFEMIELPYGGKKYSMLVMLPNEGYSVRDLVDQLTSANLDAWVRKINNATKTVYLPRFEFRYEETLNATLKSLGMNDAFVPNAANFKGITEAEQIFISKVIHKSYIKVDEKGTEAAAVTSIGFTTTSIGYEDAFNVNHPFVFAIREKDTNAVLFVGVVKNPAVKE